MRRRWRDVGFYQRVAICGFLLFPAVGYIAIGAVMAVAGQRIPPGTVAPLTVGAVYSFVLAVALFLFRRVLPVLIAAVPLLLIALALGAFGIEHPDSVFDFATALSLLAGPTVGVVACVAALRRRDARAPGRFGRTVLLSASAVFVVLNATSVVLTTTQGGAGGAPAGSVVIDMRVDRFVPDQLRAESGGSLQLYLVNHDSFAHTFTFETSGEPGELEIDEYIAPRARRLIVIDLSSESAPGSSSKSYFSCEVTGHEDMKGSLLVTN